MENHPFDVLPRPCNAAVAQMNKASVMRRNHMLLGKETNILKLTRGIFAWQNQGMKPPSQASDAESIR